MKNSYGGIEIMNFMKNFSLLWKIFQRKILNLRIISLGSRGSLVYTSLFLRKSEAAKAV